MTPLRTRILLADDHAVVRRGLRLVLDGEPDLHVVAEAADGVEALSLALREDVELAVLDVAMPGMTGLQVTRELATRRPGLRTLLLSMHDSEQYLLEAARAGAGGYVLPMLERPLSMSSLAWTFEPVGWPQRDERDSPDAYWQYDVRTVVADGGYAHTSARIWDARRRLRALSRQTVAYFG